MVPTCKYSAIPLSFSFFLIHLLLLILLDFSLVPIILLLTFSLSFFLDRCIFPSFLFSHPYSRTFLFKFLKNVCSLSTVNYFFICLPSKPSLLLVPTCNYSAISLSFSFFLIHLLLLILLDFSLVPIILFLTFSLSFFLDRCIFPSFLFSHPYSRTFLFKFLKYFCSLSTVNFFFICLPSKPSLLLVPTCNYSAIPLSFSFFLIHLLLLILLDFSLVPIILFLTFSLSFFLDRCIFPSFLFSHPYSRTFLFKSLKNLCSLSTVNYFFICLPSKPSLLLVPTCNYSAISLSFSFFRIHLLLLILLDFSPVPIILFLIFSLSFFLDRCIFPSFLFSHPYSRTFLFKFLKNFCSLSTVNYFFICLPSKPSLLLVPTCNYSAISLSFSIFLFHLFLLILLECSLVSIILFLTFSLSFFLDKCIFPPFLFSHPYSRTFLFKSLKNLCSLSIYSQLFFHLPSFEAKPTLGSYL